MKTKKYPHLLFYLNLTFILILFWGCEKEYDNVVENQQTSISVSSVSPTDSIKYLVTDSLVTIKIVFNDFNEIESAYCDIYDVDNLKLNSAPVFLFDNGDLSIGDSTSDDGKFANKFPLSTYYPNGKYYINFFVNDNAGQTKLVAVTNFIFNNGQPNKIPFISNAIMPDSINVSTNFVFSVFAQDSNGYKDLKRVYFQLYRPDSSLVVGGNGISKFDLDDKGNLTVFGDVLGGDGIFSYKNSFSSTAQKGFWRFEFEAEDRAGLVSNKITKSIKVL